MHELDSRAVGFASIYQCPDCQSESELEVDAFGMHHMHVYHDPTCPWLALRGGQK